MKRTLLAAALVTLAIPPAWAHFQLAYTPEVNIEKPGQVPMKFIFWHPMENGHAMDMGAPESVQLFFKKEKIDLTSKLTPFTFKGAANSSKAFEVLLDVKRNGDYIVALTPKPYYEKSEDKYIQQITKSFLNKGGVPSGWNEPLGLPTEIVPLNKPTNVLAGSTFSGVVMSEGKPVAGVEIEIEYMSAPAGHEGEQGRQNHRQAGRRRRAGCGHGHQRRLHLRHSQGRLLGLRRPRLRSDQEVRGQGAQPGRRDLGQGVRFEVNSC